MRIAHVLLVAALIVVSSTWRGAPRAQTAAPASFKITFFNIKSGKGQTALPGFPTTFADTANCTNRQQPLNAWGTGVVQSMLRTEVAADPAIVALGLAEAWPCATPAAVRDVLGWKAHSTERNGVAIVARHGFAGAEQWLQLDTSLNVTPADTMWVVRVPVCLDAACTDSVVVFNAHWYASGLTSGAPPAVTSRVFDRQSQQTVEFLQREPALTPHVLIGDLNVFAGTQPICNQNPWNAPLRRLAEAGYLDAWAHLHGADGGFTAVWNRAGCGVPSGNLWKRIDYSWSRYLTPIAMTRFGLVTPGHEAPSDHAGIVVEYAPAAAPPPTLPPPSPGPPFGSVDVPEDGARLAGEVAIGGWVLDDSGIAAVEIYRSAAPGEPDGQVFVGRATLVDGARPDVAREYPAYPGAGRAGWGYMLLSNLLPGAVSGTVTLSAYALTNDGTTALIGSRTIALANGSARAPFGTIDTPAQGAVVSGTLINFGWALTPLPSGIPVDGSTIDVYVDGVLRGHPVYNNYRADIATLFPGHANSTGAVGYFEIDTRTLANGVHTIAWLVRNADGQTSGIGSRYFTVANR